ncbi:MAG: hypothetical protein ABR907_14930 [Terracidiphilus sp.]|jgi:hypothetical protein
MELTFNLVWVLLAVLLVRHWLRHTSGESARTLTHVAALGMLILILFPVISVTDDLVAVQNPAELDCCARRNHVALCAHSVFPTAVAPPPQDFAGLSVGFLPFVAPGPALTPYVEIPALTWIENRPPPTA